MLPTQSHIWEKSLVQLAAIVVAPWPLNGSFWVISKTLKGIYLKRKKGSRVIYRTFDGLQIKSLQYMYVDSN